MNAPGADDPRTVHLFTDAATWTVLAAISALTAHDDPACPSAAIDVTPFNPSHRAAWITLRAERPADMTIPQNAAVVAWDQPAERWASARGVRCRSAPACVTIPSHMISPRHDARRGLGLGDGELAAAVLDSATARVTPKDAALLAAATGLSGTPAAIVIFTGETPNPGDARSLSSIGRGARVISTTDPPWRVLAGCDLALRAAAPETGDELVSDLARWAVAAGVPVARPPEQCSDSNPARRRFALARMLVRALDGEPDAIDPAPGPLVADPVDESSWLDLLRAALDADYSSA